MHGTHEAKEAGAVAPTNDEAHGSPQTAGPNDQDAGFDCRPIVQAEQLGWDFATLQAEAAMRGITVHRIADVAGAVVYLIGRWACTRSCPSLADARALIERMGGQR